MNSIRPFNLSKQALRDPPTAFDLFAPSKKDPYRMNAGKPGSEETLDRVRAGNQPSAINPTSGGGSGQFENEKWPSDNANLITNDEGREIHESPPGMDAGHGDTNFDDASNQAGQSGSDIGFARSNQVAREVDDNGRDRKPYNVNSANGVLKGVRQRLRNL